MEDDIKVVQKEVPSSFFLAPWPNKNPHDVKQTRIPIDDFPVSELQKRKLTKVQRAAVEWTRQHNFQKPGQLFSAIDNAYRNQTAAQVDAGLLANPTLMYVWLKQGKKGISEVTNLPIAEGDFDALDEYITTHPSKRVKWQEMDEEERSAVKRLTIDQFRDPEADKKRRFEDTEPEVVYLNQVDTKVAKKTYRAMNAAQQNTYEALQHGAGHLMKGFFEKPKKLLVFSGKTALQQFSWMQNVPKSAYTFLLTSATQKWVTTIGLHQFANIVRRDRQFGAFLGNMSELMYHTSSFTHGLVSTLAFRGQLKTAALVTATSQVFSTASLENTLYHLNRVSEDPAGHTTGLVVYNAKQYLNLLNDLPRDATLGTIKFVLNSAQNAAYGAVTGEGMRQGRTPIDVNRDLNRTFESMATDLTYAGLATATVTGQWWWPAALYAMNEVSKNDDSSSTMQALQGAQGRAGNLAQTVTGGVSSATSAARQQFTKLVDMQLPIGRSSGDESLVDYLSNAARNISISNPFNSMSVSMMNETDETQKNNYTFGVCQTRQRFEALDEPQMRQGFLEGIRAHRPIPGSDIDDKPRSSLNKDRPFSRAMERGKGLFQGGEEALGEPQMRRGFFTRRSEQAEPQENVDDFSRASLSYPHPYKRAVEVGKGVYQGGKQLAQRAGEFVNQIQFPGFPGAEAVDLKRMTSEQGMTTDDALFFLHYLRHDAPVHAWVEERFGTLAMLQSTIPSTRHDVQGGGINYAAAARALAGDPESGSVSLPATAPDPNGTAALVLTAACAGYKALMARYVQGGESQSLPAQGALDQAVRNYQQSSNKPSLFDLDTLMGSNFSGKRIEFEKVPTISSRLTEVSGAPYALPEPTIEEQTQQEGAPVIKEPDREKEQVHETPGGEQTEEPDDSREGSGDVPTLDWNLLESEGSIWVSDENQRRIRELTESQFRKRGSVKEALEAIAQYENKADTSLLGGKGTNHPFSEKKARQGQRLRGSIREAAKRRGMDIQ